MTDGAVVSLAHDLPLQPSAETPFPAHHHMLTAGDARDNSGIPGYEACGDYVGTQVHGLGITHVDALSHMFVKGEMFGGRPPTDVRSDGARTNTVMTLADGLVGRGVLLDVPRSRGVDFLAGDVAIGVADLEAAEADQGVTVGAGDFLLVSTGRDARRARPPAAGSTRSARAWPACTPSACRGSTSGASRCSAPTASRTACRSARLPGGRSRCTRSGSWPSACT